MLYTGAPRRAFQLPVAHEVEPKAREVQSAVSPAFSKRVCLWYPRSFLREWRDSKFIEQP